MDKNLENLSELRLLRESLININTAHKERLSGLEKIALWATQKIGSVGFFVVLASWSFLWIAWNTIGPEEFRFDPYPAFELWLFIANIIQLILLPLLMVGQNLLSRHAEARAEADFKVNQISEKEISLVLSKLDEILDKVKNINQP